MDATNRHPRDARSAEDQRHAAVRLRGAASADELRRVVAAIEQLTSGQRERLAYTRQVALGHLGEVLISEPLAQVLEDAARLLQVELGGIWATVVEFDGPDHDRIVRAISGEGLLVAGERLPPNRALWAPVLARRRGTLIADLAAVEGSERFLSVERLGARSAILMPIHIDDAAWGALAALSASAAAFGEADLVFVEAVANLVGAAVARDRAAEQLRDTALEVEERRVERELILQSIPSVVWSHGEDGESIFFSDRWEEMTGQTLEGWRRDGWLAIIHPDDHAKVTASWMAFMAGGQYDLRFRIIRPDTGEQRVLSERGRHVSGIRGIAYSGVTNDITEQVAAEDALRRHGRRQEVLREIGARALELPLAEAVSAVGVAVAEALGAPQAAVLPFDQATGTFTVAAASGDAQFQAVTEGPFESRIGALAIAGRSGVLIDDLEAPDIAGWLARQIVDTRCAVAAPIWVGDEPWGIVVATGTSPGAFGPADLVFIESVSNVLRAAITRSRADDALRHQALHDPLTGIGNRTLLADRLRGAIRAADEVGSLSAVLFADLDGFKDLNDAYGHTLGDAALIETTVRLSAILRESDTLARFGGDEFVVLMEGIAGVEVAVTAAERLVSSFAEPFAIGDGARLGVSIGIVLVQAGADAGEVLRDADTAMFRAKEAGRGRVEVFDQAMRQRLLHRAETEREIRTAIDRGEFVPHYQPIIDPVDGSMIGVEALVRWYHPVRGVIAPFEFLPIAQERGLIGLIDRAMLDAACRDAARWNDEFPRATTLLVNVNASPGAFRDERFAGVVGATIDRHGLSRGQFGVEFTETAVFGDAPDAARAFAMLDQIGVRLVLDDFGTGYSSLAHLRTPGLSCIKLDRSYIKGIAESRIDSAIVTSTTTLAKALGLCIVAEGIETAEQADAVIRLGIGRVQGYRFSRPLTVEKIDHILREGPPWLDRIGSAPA